MANVSNDTRRTDRSGHELLDLMTELFPICRSSTGPGVRETLRRLQDVIPLVVHEVPTGTQVFDWQIPREWHIRDAYVKNGAGRRVIDFRQSNLHVISYSRPVAEVMRWSQLRGHLRTLPDRPDWIPFRTMYFEDGWGFCLSHRQYLELEAAGDDETYEVCIDSSLYDGSLTYGEIYLPGDEPDEVLLSTHVCHPSLANDNLSGIAIATRLAQHLERRPRRLSYRLIFIPATIGAIAWLSLNRDGLHRVTDGLVLALLGHGDRLTYKRSRRGSARIDTAVQHALRHSGTPHDVVDFAPYGYDERQFGSPGIDLPMGCLMRTPNGQYPEYHTSADDLSLVTPDALQSSFQLCVDTLAILEDDRRYRAREPYCEPQLGRRGLYRAYGRDPGFEILQRAILWVLNQSDGQHTLLDIADRAGLPFSVIRRAADVLVEHQLLAPIQTTDQSALIDRASVGSPIAAGGGAS